MLSELVRKNLSILGITNVTVIPKLKVIRSAFIKKVKQFHPDKNVNLDEKRAKELEEKFKILLQAYKDLAEIITQNQDEEVEDEEEEVVRKEFNEMNFVNINKQSVVVKIPTSHAETWKKILNENIGEAIDRSSNSNGHQYKTISGVSITLWVKKK